MNLLTDSQKKAHDFQRHLSVTANAGSGKTTVLVNRFINILLQTDVRVNQLVAITFTDKAASELKKRIADALVERMKNETKRENKLRLEEIRSQLCFAHIGTIHSFCARLLREYPVEARVDAGFTVLEGVDQQILEREAISETFEGILQTPSPGADEKTREPLLFAVRALGRKEVQDYLSFLLAKREQVERLVADNGIFRASATDSEILATWKGILEGALAPLLNDPRWRMFAARLLQAAAGKEAAAVKEQLLLWRDDLPLHQKIQIYSSVVLRILTRADTIRKSLMARNHDVASLSGETKFLSSHRNAIERIFPDGLTSLDEGHAMLLLLNRTLLLLFQRAWDRYDAKKAEHGALDFEDLQLRTRSLLQNSLIRGRLAQKFRYIMVDEYQDTNRLQYEILRPLVADFQSGNLFIVGDPKQSIYGFRDADVEVFEATKRDIDSHAQSAGPFQWNTSEIDSTEEERTGRVVLADSFRLLTNIVAFVNHVFSRTMQSAIDHPSGEEGSLAPGISYNELVRGRLNDAPGSVELMLIRDSNGAEDGGSGDEPLSAIEKECAMIARRVLALQQAGHVVYQVSAAGSKEESTRPFVYKDAAILLRSRRHLAAVEKALVEHGVPYLVSGGIGFYQTQELFDFFHYFQFLLNPHDDVALVGILRSPFFAISDAELFEVSLAEDKKDFWPKVASYAEGSQASSRLKRARDLLEEDVRVANRLPVAFLVQRILRQTGWIGTIEGVARGTQSLANIQKLLRIAREFEGRGFTSLFDFVERMKTLIEEEQREGQASIGLAENCVHVMTIHAAKGLEFPVVFIPFCGSRLRYDRPPFLNPDIGVGFPVVEENDFEKKVEPPIYRLLKQRARDKRIEEEKRIFYVACTRARDMLVLSGKVGARETRDSFFGWTLDALGIDPSGVLSGTLKIPHQKVKVLEIVGERYRAKEIDDPLTVQIHTSLDSIPLLARVERKSFESTPVGELRIEPLSARTSGEFYSATQIKTYLECPAKYFLKYRLGLPEQERRPFDFDENEDANDKILGEQEGLITHMILQSIHTPEMNDDELHRLIDGASKSLILETDDQKKRLAGAVFRNVRNFVDSDFGKPVLSSREFFAEYTINAILGGDYLTGTIDRLYKTDDGTWSIVDYKTDFEKPEDLPRRAEYYRPQVEFYALLVHRLLRQPSVRASLVFTSLRAQPFHFNFDEQMLKAFETTVRAVIEKIKSGDFDRTEENCSACSYTCNELFASGRDPRARFVGIT